MWCQFLKFARKTDVKRRMKPLKTQVNHLLKQSSHFWCSPFQPKAAISFQIISIMSLKHLNLRHELLKLVFYWGCVNEPLMLLLLPLLWEEPVMTGVWWVCPLDAAWSFFFFLAHPTGGISSGQTQNTLRDYTSHLAWYSRGISQEELGEEVGQKGIWTYFAILHKQKLDQLQCLSPYFWGGCR